MKYSRPIILALMALALPPIVGSCSADLSDLDECHAIAKALCDKSASCPGSTLDTSTCITDVIGQLPGGADAGVISNQLHGACGLGNKVTATNCINAINAAQCDGATQQGACGSPIGIPVAISHVVVPGDAGGGNPFDAPNTGDATGIGGSSCSEVSTASYCGALTGCGSYPVDCPSSDCPTGTSCSCQVSSTCSPAGCSCDTGYFPVCCNGTACQGDCSNCGYVGQYVQVGCYHWPQRCTDSISQNAGTCYCTNGRTIPFSCGTSGTCETLCEKG